MLSNFHRFALPVLPLALACGGPSYTRPYQEPNVQEIEARLRAEPVVKSFRAETMMDFWSGDERVRTTVLMLGDVAPNVPAGARIRINALDPAGGSTLADLACNGDTFAYIDRNDCQLQGICDGTSIAQLMRMTLEPKDFVLLALGRIPLLADATTRVRWDSAQGAEVVELRTSDGRREEIVLDARSGKTWDVRKATMYSAKGDVEWSLEQSDFTTVKVEGAKSLRVARKLHFKQPPAKADVKMEWQTRWFGEPYGDEKFVIDNLAGVPECGRK